MSDKMMLTLQDLQVLAATAERNGTSRNFPEVALQWAAGAQAEIERLRATLCMVADIAHSGGLAQHNDFTALTAIRRLTLDAWNPHGTTDEHRERVKDAGREAVRRSGA